MKNDEVFERLREASWRRKLTPAEEAQLRSWVAAHPEGLDSWQSEAALNEALDRLRPVPVSSNFTARTVQGALNEAAAELRRAQRGWGAWFGRARWIPKLAFASIVFAAGLFAYHEIHEARLGEIRDSLVTISEVPSLANPEILQDFDAIRVMSKTPAADEDLIRLLQ